MGEAYKTLDIRNKKRQRNYGKGRLMKDISHFIKGGRIIHKGQTEFSATHKDGYLEL
jgi:hypothetical protein